NSLVPWGPAVTAPIALDNLLHIVIITAIHADTEPGFAGTPVSPGENLVPGAEGEGPVASGRSPAVRGRAGGRLQGQQDHDPPGAPRAGADRPYPPRAGSRHLRAAAAAHRGTAAAEQLQRGEAPAGRPGVLCRARAGDRRGVGRRGVDARHRRGGTGLPPAPAPARARRGAWGGRGPH